MSVCGCFGAVGEAAMWGLSVWQEDVGIWKGVVCGCLNEFDNGRAGLEGSVGCIMAGSWSEWEIAYPENDAVVTKSLYPSRQKKLKFHPTAL